MKKIYSIIGLILASFFTACQDDNIVKEQGQPVKSGDEIVFNAVSGYNIDARSSRTLYSGATYTENGITYERIEWEVDKDIIGIYCANANNVQYADYRITALDVEENKTFDKTHHAILARHEQSSGLHWGTGNHEFFAIYPSPTIPDQNGSSTSLVGRVKLEGNVLSGYVPTTQTPIEIVDDKAVTNTSNGNTTTLRTATKWAKPDMRYSYMIARAEATPADEHVDLRFKPISTALEIDINTGNAQNQSLTITSVTIQSKTGKPITGYFTCPIKEDGTPDTENIELSNTSSSLTIQLGATGIALTKEQTLRVTALLLPTAVSEGDLRLTISGDSNFGGDQTGTLTSVYLEAHKKHYIANLPLKSTPVVGNNWISRLDDNIYLGGLSIPGAANAFSSAYTGTNSQYYRTQSQNFEALWNMGVRCFELVCDRTSGNSAVTNLGNASLRCNNVELGKNVAGAIDDIITKLNNEESKNEFAMVILTYQPTGNRNAARDPEAFMTALNNYYKNKFPNENTGNNDQLIVYSPGLRVDQARGKLMIIARPSQEGEDSETAVSNAKLDDLDILTVKGWGSLMDKWSKRGYGTKIFMGGDSNGHREDNRTAYSELRAMEEWIYGNNFTQSGYSESYHPYPMTARITDSNDPRPTKGEIDYTYETDKGGIAVWAQEWRRVIDLDDNKENDNGTQQITHRIGSANRDYMFFESYAEKKADILATYNKAISDESRSMVYFNSLDGFYMLTDNYVSFGPYWVGNMGNIQDYALDINEWFYNTALSKAEANGTGTMGVIIMDYIGENLGDINGELLPKAIYNNNFKSTLPADKKDPEEGSGEAGGDDDGGFGGGNGDE